MTPELSFNMADVPEKKAKANNNFNNIHFLFLFLSKIFFLNFHKVQLFT